MTSKVLMLVLAFSTLTATSAACGQSLRCRNGLVSVGDSTESVQKACGEPDRRETNCESGPPQGDPRVTGCLEGENWIYRPGYGQFVTTLRFEDGALVKITYGDRQ